MASGEGLGPITRRTVCPFSCRRLLTLRRAEDFSKEVYVEKLRAWME